MNAVITRIRNWLKPSHDVDYFAVEKVARRMLDDYRGNVAIGAGRTELGTILTGIAGCELAMSRACEAMGWNPDPTPDEPSVAESGRLSGLLLQEIAYCAAEGKAYRGVRCRELEIEPVATALLFLALAYDGASTADPLVGYRLSVVWHAVLDVIGGQASESLVPLMLAHGYSPHACTCPTCTAPSGDHAGLPSAERQRRARAS